MARKVRVNAEIDDEVDRRLRTLWVIKRGQSLSDVLNAVLAKALPPMSELTRKLEESEATA
jgi:hypothetical protein